MKSAILEKMDQKASVPLLMVLVIAAVAIGGYFIYTNYKTSVFDRTNNRTTVPLPTPSVSLIPTSSDKIVNWKIRSQAASPDGSKTLAIKTSGMADTFIKALVTLEIEGNKEYILISQKGIDANSWEDIAQNNWSPDSKYVYLKNIPPDGGDIYIFKANGEKFSNNKNYLLSSELGYNGLPIIKVAWISSTQLQIEGGVGLIIQPMNFKKYILDISKETLNEVN